MTDPIQAGRMITVMGSDLDGVELLCKRCAHVWRPSQSDWPTIADLIDQAETHEREHQADTQP